MTEKSPMGKPETVISPAVLRQQCSAASNRSARVSLGLEKLAVRIPDRHTADQARALASTVADFVNEMDVLAVLLEGAGDASLSVPSRRRLASLTSDAEELASLTSSLVGRGEVPGGARLEKLAETKATWNMMLQLVAAFQSLVQIQDEEDAAQVLEMTGSDFDELQRLIAQVQFEPSSHQQSEGLPPDYDTAVCSPSPSTSSYPLDHKQPILTPEELNQPSSSSTPTSLSTFSRPKRGKVGGFFRSISSKFAAPVEPLVTPLCRAAEAGDTKNLTGLLGQGANPNGINDDGYTPLTSAIHSTSNPDIPATVRLLLSSGADPSARDAVWSLPPLWHASRAGRADVASLLLDAGADPRGRNAYGAPYFADAAEKDPPALIELLLRRGADPDAANLTGRKVVVSAVEHNDMARTRILLDAGATVSATNTTGHPLLAIAVANRNLDMVSYLISQGANPSGRNGFGEALVSLATAPGAIDIARLLLVRGADPDSKSLAGQPCLVSALQHDLPDTTRLLLEHGADANAKDITGRPILAMAISQKRYAHATLLLEHGADPSIAGNRSGSAHLITTHLKNKSPDQAGLLRLMLRQGAKPDVMPSSWDGHGGSANTPLGYCVSESLPELVAILVAAGADPHRAGQTGTVPFSDPLGKTTPFRLAATQGRVGCLKAMLEGGAVAKLRGKPGVDADEVLLQAAAAAGENREVVEMLLDEGVERPAWAAAFTEREGGEALRAAVQDRASKLGVDGGWFQVRRRTTAVGGDAPPPPYEGGL